MPHSYERRTMEYSRWESMLNTILHNHFGISVADSFDEEQLRNFFNCGDSPKDVAGELERKWELVDIESH